MDAEIATMFFITEYKLEFPLGPEWQILVCGGRWVYRSQKQAWNVVRICASDHDDPIACAYRIRAATSEQVLAYASELDTKTENGAGARPS